MSGWTEFFGDKLLTKDGEKPTAEVLADKTVVGIYFSAHWCPPCRAFTPELSTFYEEIVETHPDFEIVFCSSDQDADSFNEYYGEMTFKALPFENREAKAALSCKYGIQGIPTLLFLNGKGELITEDGREVVYKANGDVDAFWSALQ